MKHRQEKSMSYTGINEVQLSSRRQQPWLDTMARGSVYGLLERLQIGRLVLEDATGRRVFGEMESDALTATVKIHDARAFREIMLRGTNGAGEAYMLGYWSSPALVKVIRIMVLNLRLIDEMDRSTSLKARASNLLVRLLSANTLRGSRRNIGAHYDLGNDFFRLFLDQRMMYSAAIYPTAQASLEEAALNKLDTVCRKLQLRPEDHLLEIGTGWGGMAIHAARYYGCRVTTTTISTQQYDYARARVAAEGLADKVTVLLKDYRELEGRYDKLVSIEMVEAVGHQYYSEFFGRCNALLKPRGIMVMQAITIPDQRYDQARRSVDFIQKYIFPGGCLPSNAIVAQHIAQDTDMQMTDFHDITEDYARTLAHWHERFHARLQEVREQGFDETFIRMWEFYLCYCEGGFAERVIGTAQFTFMKSAFAVLPASAGK
jgi:cyclopropane-fatty-acyl-phospholipid synthase